MKDSKGKIITVEEFMKGESVRVEGGVEKGDWREPKVSIEGVLYDIQAGVLNIPNGISEIMEYVDQIRLSQEEVAIKRTPEEREEIEQGIDEWATPEVESMQATGKSMQNEEEATTVGYEHANPEQKAEMIKDITRESIAKQKKIMEVTKEPKSKKLEIKHLE
jgi:hypothetical protein